jgi:hypothetical protein
MVSSMLKEFFVDLKASSVWLASPSFRLELFYAIEDRLDGNLRQG